MRALVLHHDANSTSGLVGAALRERGFELDEHFICDQVDSPIATGPLPHLDGVDLVVALGSRWSVYDRTSVGGWIDDELELLRTADRRGVPTLGICFGAQALAAAHGATVRRAHRPEIGWSDVDSEIGQIAAGPWFQWHFDVFETPRYADLLARSPSGAQAFRLRRNVGVQFHPELDRVLLELWMVNDRAELRAAGVDPDALVEETIRMESSASRRCGELVDWFLADVASSATPAPVGSP